MKKKPHIIVICGPTATGKSDLAVHTARLYKGEVISADSRQVYTGLNIGTGKITKKEMRGVPHHMLDVCDPKKTYTVSDWQRNVTVLIQEIIARGHTPIICGGTGFYIDAITKNIILPAVPPNKKLRTQLEKKSTPQLMVMLQRLDSKRANDIDPHNRVRLIRAIEIVHSLGRVPSLKEKPLPYHFIKIGLTMSSEDLKEKIHTRLMKRINTGFIKEIKTLHAKGLSWKRMYMLGLEYRYGASHIQGKSTKEGTVRDLTQAIYQYAKRQITWFKRDPQIQWFHPKDREGIEVYIHSLTK